MTARYFLLVATLGICVSAGSQIPKLAYATYFGGSGTDTGYAIAVDKIGSTYIAGFTQSADLPVLQAFQPYYARGSGDLFVAKLWADGSLAYATYIGGSGREGDPGGYVGGIAVDDAGNAYVAGVTRSADFPITPTAFQRSIGSQFACDSDPEAGLCGDAFVLKLSPNGDRLLYSTFLGGRDYDDAKAIALDSEGAAYVTGITASADFPVTPGALQTTLHDVEAYVVKLSPDGTSLEYSTLIGGTGVDAGMTIAVDSSGNVYVAGTTQAFDFPLRNPVQRKSDNSWDAFVVCLETSGTSLSFSTVLGGDGVEQALAIALDNSGHIYVAGSTSSGDFPTKNAFQPVFGGNTNGFVTKLIPATGIVYSSFLGGASGPTILNAIAIDENGAAYIAGQGSDDFPAVNSLQRFMGTGDGVVAKLTPDGSGLLFSTFLGGSSSSALSGIALAPDETVSVIGMTDSSDFPITIGAVQRWLAGGSDAFLARMQQPAVAGPILSAPKLLSLGSAYAGQSSSGSMSVRNTGTLPLAVSRIEASSNINVISDCSTVSPGGSCLVSTTMKVGLPGVHMGTITMYDNALDSPQTFYVRATAITGADLELSSVMTQADFALYGRRATPVIATITNHGPNESQDAFLQTTSDSGSTDCNPCYVGQIAAGATVTVRLNFLPTRYGATPVTIAARESSSTPDLNSTNDSRTLTIANPRYSASAMQVVFGNQVVGTSSASQHVTFTSLDGLPLQLSITGTAEFHPGVSCAGISCVADVVFTPEEEGPRKGLLTIIEPALSTTQTVSVAGTGSLAPHLGLLPLNIGFASTAVGQKSDARSIEIVNDGSAPLFIVEIRMEGNFSQTNNCPPSLAPGTRCAIALQFTPTMAGSRLGTLTIVHNAESRLNSVLLSGSGVAPAIVTRPIRPGVIHSTASLKLPPTGPAHLNRMSISVTRNASSLASVPDRLQQPSRKSRLRRGRIAFQR